MTSPLHAQQTDRSIAAQLWNMANHRHRSSNPLGSSFENMCCLGLENKVRKEWAEDANTMAAQGWLPIKFSCRTKTTSDLGLVSLRAITTRPFAMIHEAYSTPLPLQMQAMTQSRAIPIQCAHLARTIHAYLLRRPILSPGRVFLVRPPRRTTSMPTSALLARNPGELRSRTPRDGTHE